VHELSLFTGAGGGVLGTKLIGWRTVGYVEWEPYCQQVIGQRIQDGFLDEAPIFGDIDHFIESGAAKKYAGFVDVVTAGFPCQPFSVAGKKKGQDDERNKWPQTIQCIRDVRPRYALLENVPGLLNSGYFSEILTSLAEAGFDARWCVLGADDVGAPHRRKRLWILAYPKGGKDDERKFRHMDEEASGRQSLDTPAKFGSSDVADSRCVGWGEGADEQRVFGKGQPSSPPGGRGEGQFIRRSGEDVADSEDIGCERTLKPSDSEIKGWDTHAAPTTRSGSSGGYWSTEPNVGRVANGVASRVDRLKAIGNGQVPAVAATAWTILSTGT